MDEISYCMSFGFDPDGLKACKESLQSNVNKTGACPAGAGL